MDAPRQCPDCGTTLPENALNENCPRCLFEAALADSSAEQSPQNATAPGDVICAAAQLAVRQNIGDGGMGVVFEAHDAALGRSVAVKLMRPEHRARGQAGRFLREAKILGQLEHPNVVPIHALGSDEAGEPFYAMKLVKGATLNEVLDNMRRGDAETIRRFPLSELLTVFQKVCDAVAFAHSRGIIHRDLKPENIMIGEYGEVLVMDWGIAKILREESDDTESDSRPASGDVRFTMQGAVIGTPTSMAPEQAGGRVMEHDERTDIFALGGILYQILTLRPAVTGTTVEEILENVMRGYIPPPVLFNQRQRLLADEAPVRLAHCPNEKIPAALSAVAMQAMSVQPTDRYQTVAELQHDITAYQSGFATAAERAGPLKQFALFVRRHKALAIASVAAVLTTTGFMAKIITSERRATHTLAELRKAIPLMRGEVDSLIQQRKFEEALAKLDYLTSLAPTNAEFHWLRGNMLQSLLRLSEARDAYEAALRNDANFVRATEARDVSISLIKRPLDGSRIDDDTVKLLHELMNRQGRLPEAVVLLTKYKGSERRRVVKEAQDRLKAAGLGTAANALTQASDGTLELRSGFNGVTKTAFLKGLPFSVLDFSGTGNQLSELEGLRGMPLRRLYLLNDFPISDWTPLSGMKLTNLSCGMVRSLPPCDYSEMMELRVSGGSRLEEIGRLADAPLVFLDISASKISNLAPLRNSKLQWLDASATSVSDLSPLARLPLRNLELHDSPVSDLAPLRGRSLTNLNLSNTKVTDLSPLSAMPLIKLSLWHTPVTNLAPLAGSSLRELVVGDSKLADIMPLARTKLLWLNISSTDVADLRPLAKLPLESLRAAATKIADLTPLRDLPLRRLEVRQCVNLTDFHGLSDLSLTNLNIGSTSFSNLSLIAHMPLVYLEIDLTKVADLSPLRGSKLKSLNLKADRKVRDIEPLRGVPLRNLNLSGTQVTNIAALQGMPLNTLDLFRVPISDIEALRGAPLQELNLDGTNVRDLSPLLDCRQLKRVALPRAAENVEVLKRLPSLEDIGYADDNGSPQFLSKSGFWKTFGRK